MKLFKAASKLQFVNVVLCSRLRPIWRGEGKGGKFKYMFDMFTNDE